MLEIKRSPLILNFVSAIVIIISSTLVACSNVNNHSQNQPYQSNSNVSLFPDDSLQQARKREEEEGSAHKIEEAAAKEQAKEEAERQEELEQSKPKGEIENISVDHNVWQGGYIGMLIHVKFTVDNFQGVDCGAAAYFYFSSGKALKDFNGAYRTDDGNVSVGTDFRPGYVHSTYEDLRLFIPYDELHLASGRYDLKFNVKLYEKNGNFFATSEYVPFIATIGPKQPLVDNGYGNLPPSYINPPINPPTHTRHICPRCHGTGTIDNCAYRNCYLPDANCTNCISDCPLCHGTGWIED
jgi:hypothetical protein